MSSIDGSLLSRFRLFHIEEPDARTAVAIARSVGRSVLCEFGLERKFTAIAGEVLQQLALLGSPRIQRQLLETAIGRAVCDGRWELRVQGLGRGAERMTRVTPASH